MRNSIFVSSFHSEIFRNRHADGSARSANQQKLRNTYGFVKVYIKGGSGLPAAPCGRAGIFSFQLRESGLISAPLRCIV